MEQRIANKKNQIARHEKSSVNLEAEKAKMTKKIKVKLRNIFFLFFLFLLSIAPFLLYFLLDEYYFLTHSSWILMNHV